MIQDVRVAVITTAQRWAVSPSHQCDGQHPDMRQTSAPVRRRRGYLLPAQHPSPNFHLQDLWAAPPAVGCSPPTPPHPILQGRPAFCTQPRVRGQLSSVTVHTKTRLQLLERAEVPLPFAPGASLFLQLTVTPTPAQRASSRWILSVFCWKCND